MQTVPRFRLGIDENGLGPRLGPMLVTAVLAEVTPEGHRATERRGRSMARLGDSKGLLSHGNVALGEAWARVLAGRGCGSLDHPTHSIDSLVHAFSLSPKSELTRHCPRHVSSQCWSVKGEAFEAEDALLESVTKDLDRLAKKGITVKAVRSVIVCTKLLNDELGKGRSRFIVDLHSMERLVLDLRRPLDGDVLAICGKVGGLGHYEDAFGPLSGMLRVKLEETRKKSAYFFPGVGEIRFVQDADASDLLVGLASIVGKWLREVLMARVARHYREGDPALPDPSGYYDPITQHFVEATRLTRKKRKVPSECFERVTRDNASGAE